MNISQPLKQALLDTGITAAELSRRMGVSKAYISELVSGRRGVTEDSLSVIAGHLGCEVTVDIRFKKIK